MTKICHATIWLLAVLTLLVQPVAAQDAERDQLKERFKQRHSQLQAAKSQSLIGETFDGYVEAAPEQSPLKKELAKLVADENQDRRRLYVLLAEDLNTTPEKVAQRNARRNFQLAAVGEWLQGKDGQWYRKPAEPEE